MGVVSGADAIGRVGLQLAWATALLVLGRYVTSLATRRVVIQGG
jgi:hypothetical protein